MPPFRSNAITQPAPQPDIKFNDKLEMRQDAPSPLIVTLPVINPSTTYTTSIALASATSLTSSSPTSLFVSTTPTQIAIPATSPESPDNGALIGGILGGFLGFFVLAAVLWKCCYNSRSALYSLPMDRRGYYNDNDSERGSDGTGSTASERMRKRGGGGSEYIRKPRSAYIRRERTRRATFTGPRYEYGHGNGHGYGHNRRMKRSWGTDSSSNGSTSRNGSTRRRRSTGPGGMMYKNGVFGWPLGGFTRPKLKPAVTETREVYRKGGGYYDGGAMGYGVRDD